MIVLPKPPETYSQGWASQYTRALEIQMNAYFNQIQGLLLNIAPKYTTASRTALPNIAGQLVYDTDLKKMFFNDGAAWHQITST